MTRRQHGSGGSGPAADHRRRKARMPAGVDYTDASTWHVAQARTAARRSPPPRHGWCLGRFVLVDGELRLLGVKLQLTFWIDPAAPFTRALEHVARWKTRQAAHQWLRAHRGDFPGVAPLNLDELLPPTPDPR